jgi:hypothetical protein
MSLGACSVFLGILIVVQGGTFAPFSAFAHAVFSSTSRSPTSTSQEGTLIPPGFRLKSSNGYTIRLGVMQASSSDDPTTFVTILVSSRTGVVSYRAPAKATEGAFDVDLGDVGNIEVSFHATGGTETESPVCNKQQIFSVASGYYEGVINFRGEEGYTEVKASQAVGDASILLNTVCPTESEGGTGPGLPGAGLRVRRSHAASNPSLTVIENNPQALVQLEANVRERRNVIAIERTIRMKASRTVFDYDPELRTAVLRPLDPFSGRARFLRFTRHRNRWSGNLTVDLPGRANVHLTGKRFTASLFHARFKGSGPLQ